MKTLLLALVIAVMATGQTTTIRSTAIEPTIANGGNNLPAHKIEPNDLIGLSVYDAPELTHTIRVRADGMITLPMLKNGIPAAGLMPIELEDVIAGTLQREEILVHPLVTVTMLEYNARRVSVVGAVVNPQTFQVTGATHLLDALAKAGGPSQDAGPKLFLHHEDGKTETFDLKKLVSGDSEGMNVSLDGGEEIRVPTAPKVYVMGNVTRPQVVLVHEPGEATVMRLLARVEGVTQYHSDVAWIYRFDTSEQKRREISVPLKAILQRKAADVQLEADDILYIPDDLKKRHTADVAKALLGAGQSISTALVYTAR
jgi:polysaccharide export outer membrane protein